MFQYLEIEEQAIQLRAAFTNRILKGSAFKKWRRTVREMGDADKMNQLVGFTSQKPPTPVSALKQSIKPAGVPQFKLGQSIRQNTKEREVEQLISPHSKQDEILEYEDGGGQREKTKEKAEKVNRDSENNPIVNLKIGDVIYFKFFGDKGSKGIISGDGIASNKLECLPQKLVSEQGGEKEVLHTNDDSDHSFDEKRNFLESEMNKQNATSLDGTPLFMRSADQQFRKCLFRVVNERKHFYQDKLVKSLHSLSQETEYLKPKVEEEKKENQANYDRLKGTNVLYGQQIQLVHLYSGCTLTLNPQVLAKQNCCREMSLEESDNQWSNFIVNSVKDTKKTGESVLYGDQMILQCAIDKNYWLNVEQSSDFGFIAPLEVNASEFSTPLKVSNYLDYKTLEERQGPGYKGKFLQAGEVVRLFNKSMNGYIGVRRKNNLSRILKSRVVDFMEDINELKMKQDYFNRSESMKELQKIYELYVHKKSDFDESQLKIGAKQSEVNSKTFNESNKQSSTDSQNTDIQTLWEIQKEESFSSTLPTFKGFFRFKNLSSGLYLSIKPKHLNIQASRQQSGRQDSQLILTFESSSVKNLFKISQVKRESLKDEAIKYNSSITIQGNVDPQNFTSSNRSTDPNLKTITLAERKVRGKREAFVDCLSKVEKSQGDRFQFEIISVDKGLRQTTDRVSSLIPFFLDFYIFLQDWGHQEPADKGNLQYSYKQAFDHQKVLFNRALEFGKSVDNLSDYLKIEGSLLRMRQDVIRDSGLLTLLILLLQLMDFKIFGKSNDPSQTLLSIHSERSPRKIAHQKLKKTISHIYSLLISCIRSNSKSCSFLISQNAEYLSFFLKSLSSNPTEVKLLVREAIKWMEESDEREQKNIAKWCRKVDHVTPNNIGIQIFVTEVLSLTMVDPFEEAISENQKYCKNILFKTVKDKSLKEIKNKPLQVIKFEQKKLLTFKIIEITEPRSNKVFKIPQVYFNILGRNADQFERENQHLRSLETHRPLPFPQNTSYGYPLTSFSGNENEIGDDEGGVKKNIASKYEQYIISVLTFYAQMCKGRNYKMIRLLQSPEIGLTDELIIMCIRIFNPFEPSNANDTIIRAQNSNYYRCFLALYQEMMLDCDPFLRISEHKANSLVKRDIRKFQISDKSYKLFHDFVLTDSKLKYINEKLKIIPNQSNGQISEERDHQEYEKLNKIADIIVQNEETSNKHSAEITSIMFSTISVEQFMKTNKNFQFFIDSDPDSILKTILQMLKIIHTRIDLGYNNLYTNSHVMKHISNIFLAYIAFKKESSLTKSEAEETDKSPTTDPHNWVYDILLITFQACQDTFLITRVILEASKIIQVLDILQRNLIIVSQIQQSLGVQIKAEFKPAATARGADGIGLTEIEMGNLVSPQDHQNQVLFLTTENNELKFQQVVYHVSDEHLSQSGDAIAGKKDKEFMIKQNNSSNSTPVKKQPGSHQNHHLHHHQEQDEDTYNKIYDHIKVGELEFDLFRQCNFQRMKRQTAIKENPEFQSLCIGSIIFETLKYSMDNEMIQSQLSKQLVSYIQQNRVLLSLFDEIEVIDDEYELKLLRDLCGDTEQQVSSKDMMHLAEKIAASYQNMIEKQKNIAMADEFQTQKTGNLKANMNENPPAISKQTLQLLKFSESLKSVIELFQLRDFEYEKNRLGLVKSKAEYFSQLQNLLRNISYHKSILHLIGASKVFLVRDDCELQDDKQGTYKDLYEGLIRFLYLFVKDNPQNRKEVLPYLPKILQLSMFQYNSEKMNQSYQKSKDYPSTNMFKTYKKNPLEISKLCIELLVDAKLESEIVKPYIQLIFDYIEKCRIKRQGNRSIIDLPRQVEEEDDVEETDLKYKAIMQAQSIYQYLKIVLTLTIGPLNVPIQANQQKILGCIISSNVLASVSKPLQTKLILKLNEFKKTQFSRVYYIIKIHSICQTIFAFCCKNHRLSTLEVHRFISSDSLKNNIMSSGTNYLLKKSYLKLYFEAYISKGEFQKQDQSDAISQDEIAEVLSYISFKSLEPKTIFQNLEGIIKIDDMYEPKENWLIRDSILDFKISQKKTYSELQSSAVQLQQFKENEELFRNSGISGAVKGVLKDSTEYWNYLFQEGVFHFISDVLDEKRFDIQLDVYKQSNLKTTLLKIKNQIQVLYQILLSVEKSFKHDDNYSLIPSFKQLLLHTSEVLSKFKLSPGSEYVPPPPLGSQFLIENKGEYNEEIQEYKQQKNRSEMLKGLSIFLLRNRMTLNDFLNHLKSQFIHLEEQSVKPIFKEVLLQLINRDKEYVSQDCISDFLKIDCAIENYFDKYATSLGLFAVNSKTDFNQKNIKLVSEYLKKNDNLISGKPQEIDYEDIIPMVQEEPFEEIDLKLLRHNLKLKILKQSNENLEKMQEILGSLKKEDTPFVHYEEQNRQMEEVFIMQILLEQIKNPSINLLCDVKGQLPNEIDSVKQAQLEPSISSFITATKKIFQNKPVYLLRFLRLLLEIKQINIDTIEDRIHNDKKVAASAERSITFYKTVQRIIGASKVHVQIIEQIIKESILEETIESLSLLFQLLNFGNQDNQQAILIYLKTEKEISLDFFSYLRNFFQKKNSEDLIQMKKSRFKNPRETVFFEVHAFLILNILQLFCENVNVEFQSFLRQQNEVTGAFSANTNIIMETANFLSFLLEDNEVEIEFKSKLVRQALETLVDFSTGSNKRMFSFLQEKVFEMQISFKKPSLTEKPHLVLRQENKIDLLNSSIRFLLSMVEGNSDTKTLVHIVDHIDCEKMMRLIYRIYSERLMQIQRKLVLEIPCKGDMHPAHEKCNDSVCVHGDCTDYDRYLNIMGYSIFVIFCYLIEPFEGNSNLDLFTKQLDRRYSFSPLNFDEELPKRQQYLKNFDTKLRNQNQQNILAAQAQAHLEAIQQKELLKNNLPSRTVPKGFTLPYAGNDPKLLSQMSHKIVKRLDQGYEEVSPNDKQKSVLVKIFLKSIKQKPKFVVTTQFKVLPTKENRKYTQTGDRNSDKEEFGMGLTSKHSLFKIILTTIKDIEMMEQVPRYFFFFKSQIGITEVQQPEAAIKLIFESNRESDEDRLMFLIENYQFYHKQMKYNQWFQQFAISNLIHSWRIIKDTQFAFLLLIVAFQIFFLDGESTSSDSTYADELMYIFTIVQLCLTFLVLVFCAIDRFKISIYRFTNTDSFRKKEYLKENSGLVTDNIFKRAIKLVFDIQDQLKPENFKRRSAISRCFVYVFLLVLDIENFYHIWYLLVTLAGFYLKGPLVYAILLLDIVKRSDSLQQIIKSITQNLFNIFIFSYLGIIVMYIYGIGGFYFFRADFKADQKVYNNSFILAVTSVINLGLRNGGGISESLESIKSYTVEENNVSSSYYWGRYFYDLSFFILINMLFIQIIFGIILDTFEELRKEQDSIREEVVNKCFVCSMSRGYIDGNSEKGWYDHIYLRHNVYHQMFYLFYVQQKDETECNALEKYVKRQLEQKLVEFIPVRQSSDIEEQEEIEIADVD